MSYVAYFKKDAKAEERPITFFYNGGPGSSTVWLHMGSLGPKHVVTAGDQHLPAAPYKLVDNANSLLDVSDLVFIDAAGNRVWPPYRQGCRRRLSGAWMKMAVPLPASLPASSPSTAAGTRPNLFSVRATAPPGRPCWPNPRRDEIDRPERRDSSFADLQLQHRYRRRQNNPGVDLPYDLVLPTYAATAWYHKKLPQQPAALEPFLKEVEEFAVGPFSHASGPGNRPAAMPKSSPLRRRLHDYTGLPVAYLLKANLRVSGGEFEKTFQDETDLTIGRYDTRFTGPTINPLERKRGLRSAKRGYLFGLRFPPQRLHAARS